MQVDINRKKLKKQVIQTEVGELPPDWKVFTIKELASITTGSRNTQDRIEGGQFPFYVRSQTVESIDTYSYDGEAVLTAGDGVGTGKVFHYINGKFDFHQRVYKISDFDKKLDGYFFFLFFSKNFYDRIIQMTAKSSVDSVRMEMIADMNIPVPPKAEQTAIATALSDADALIQSLEKLIAKKRLIKQGAMQELLKPREGWVLKKLGEVGDIDPENLGNSTDPEYMFNYLSLEDVDRGVLKRTNEIKFKDAPSRARRIVRKNDILFSTVRPNLMSHFIVLNNVKDLVCSTGFSVIRCFNDFIPDYVYNLLFSSYVNKQIDTLISGSNYPAINSDDVHSLKIPVPSLQEQFHNANVFRDMDIEIELLESKLEKYKQIKQGMMQNLLTGKIRLV